MIDVIEKLNPNRKFIETKFEDSPFQLRNDEGDNLSQVFDSYIKNNKEEEKIESNNIKIENDEYLDLNYKNKKYKIFKKPIDFYTLSYNEPAFKVYNYDQYHDVILELKNYYFFVIGGKSFSFEDIYEMKNNKNIRLIPFIITIFINLNIAIKLEEAKTNEGFIELDKEKLDPFYLYFEKLEIKKRTDPENFKNFNLNILDDKLALIINDERIKFIDDLDKYVKIDYQKEPYILIGNDGVGKSITLQLYTGINLKDHKKLYFNLKLMEKLDLRIYFCIELMRCFLSREPNSPCEKDFEKYIKCVNKIQNCDFSKISNFFEILNIVLEHLKFESRYIIILDQFNYEYITDNEFNIFKNKIPDYKNFKLIICCSLFDNKNKEKIFSNYNICDIIRLNRGISESKIFDNNENDIQNLNRENTIEDNNNNINFGNFYLFKKRKREININIKLMENKKDNKKNPSEKDLKKENKNQEKKKRVFKSNVGLYKFNYDLPNLLKNLHANISDVSDEKKKIYYNKLISMETIIKQKEKSQELIKCMSDFGFLPKYYSKFLVFKIIQNLNGITNESEIIKLFYKEEEEKITKNIEDYYIKLFKLSQNNSKYPHLNIYKSLLKLDKTISKTYETSINFYKLYKYSLAFPFKYLIIETENKKETNFINFNESTIKEKFKIWFSFPFLNDVIKKMIETYNNDETIDIQCLSGSAYGNALELKIRKNISQIFDTEIEIRKVWSLGIVSENSKKQKEKEINNKTFKSIRFQNLEDITGIKDIKKSKNKIFYYKPEYQDNYLIDSLFLIKINPDDYKIIALQITKNKTKNQIRQKTTYEKHLIANIKKKYEKLYNINIVSIYLWFILSNDSPDNDNTCSYLSDQNIEYAFYSIKQKCFFAKRNNGMINDFDYFLKNEAAIFPKDNNKNNNLINIYPQPVSILLFEEKLFKLSEYNSNINYENVRKEYFNNNFGPKIDDTLKRIIIKKLKDYIKYKNEFELLYLFSFPYYELHDFKLYDNNNELIYLLKLNDRIIIVFKDNYFNIDYQNNLIYNCEPPNINNFGLNNKIIYNDKEMTLSSIKNFNDNEIIYLYKIYYLGDMLILKN